LILRDDEFKEYQNPKSVSKKDNNNLTLEEYYYRSIKFSINYFRDCGNYSHNDGHFLYPSLK